MKSKDGIVLDSETTGLLRPNLADVNLQPFMTEIYCIRVDKKNRIIDEFESLFKIPIPVPEHITRITQITDEMLEFQEPFNAKFKEISKFFKGAEYSLGHNVNFDLDMIKFEARRMGLERKFNWTKKSLCTVELSFPIENKRLKLGYLHELATGNKISGAHRARADVMATLECYKWLKEVGLA